MKRPRDQINAKGVAHTRRHLQMLAELQHGMYAGQHVLRYQSFQELVLQEGVDGTVTAETFSIPTAKGHRGPMGECFRNAANMVMDWRDTQYGELIYCEGFATCVIPVLHAWCITSSGQVLDPTWTSGSGYVGIPFQPEYLRTTLCQRRRYGLIDNPEMDFPLLATGPTGYRWSPANIVGFQNTLLQLL